MRAINASVMRQANRTLLLNRIRMRPISRAELAEETGLTRASVTQIVEELINEGMVIETSMVERSRLGRRSTQLAISAQAGYTVGVALGPMECTVGVTDMLGQVLMRSIELVNGREPGAVLDAVAGIIAGQLKTLGVAAEKVFGIGVSVPGPVDQKYGIAQNLTGMESWNGIALRRELSSRTGMKVYSESAANAQALEQKYFGSAGENFALVRMEDALSVGVVVQDALYRGSAEFAVELGQCPAGPDGGQTLNELLAGDGRMSWRRMLEKPDEPETEQALLQLSYPLASVMCVYQVRHAALGGSVGERLKPLLPKLLQRVQSLLPVQVSNGVTLTVAETDLVRMAASVVYHRIFSLV